MSNLFDEIRVFLEKSAKSGKPPLIVVLGPTASGKTALSIKIAKAFGGEVISADSRQIYKYMDIGTEKITETQKEGVPHHLLDIVEPHEEFSLSDFKRKALKAANDILRRGKVPILCGGTGLYINAIVENYRIPEVPPQYEIRQELAQYHEEHGANALHDLLKEKDPEAAVRIHPNNVRYVIRALEINMGGNINKRDEKGEPMFNVFSTGIDWPREALYERINGRVHDQMERGLIDEIKMLLTKGYAEGLPAMTSLGYAEMISYIKGDTDLQTALDSIQKNTRNYAKRQLTWFRRYKGIRWIVPGELMDLFENAGKTGIGEK